MKLLALFLIFASAVLAVVPPAGYPDFVDAGYPQVIAAKYEGIPANTPIDATFQRSNGKIYFFAGDKYWRITDKYLETGVTLANDTVDAGYPQSIYAKWGIQGPIQAIFQRKNGKIYAFSGNYYYRFTDKYLDDRLSDSAPDAPDAGYPKVITEHFLGLPSSIDAGFYRTSGHMYFFKDAKYYRLRDKYFFEDLNDSLPDAVEPCYPKNITTGWRGAPVPVQAAFQRVRSNQEIYFFSGNQYYRFTDKYLRLDFPNLIDSGYPLKIAARWLQCSGNSRVPDSPDAVFQRVNGKIYFFQGSLYWRVTDKYLVDNTEDCVDAGYPKSIAANWIGVPDNIDGVFQRSNGGIYFFKGSQYYRVSDKYLSDNTSRADEVDAGYPQTIASKWIGVPDNINSVYQQPDGIINFYANSQYYEVKDKYFFKLATDAVSPGFPTNMADEYPEIPANPHAVFERSSNAKVYAFSLDSYYRLSDQVLSEAPPCCAASTTAPTPVPTQDPNIAKLLSPAIFSYTYYTANYPDLARNGITSLTQVQAHWVSAGVTEGRRASASFDAAYYLRTYSDVASAFGPTNYKAAVLHYVDYGMKEGRLGCSGCVITTAAPTTAAPTLDATLAKLLNAFVFDPTYYLNRYPDLSANGINTAALATTHWVNNGIKEGRRASSFLDPPYYLNNNADLLAAFGVGNYKSAIIHYVDYGRVEGRKATA